MTSEANKTFTFKEARINYTDSGKGRAIVLLHGLTESLEIWKEFSEALAKQFRVICIDLPGHGKSECLGYVHTMELMADCVHSLLKNLRLKKYVVVGHSMGGYVAVALGELYPDNIKGLCLFHSTASSDTTEKQKDRERTIKVIKQNHKSFIQKLIPGLFAEQNKKKLKAEISALKKVAAKTPKQGLIAAMEGMKIRPDREIILRFAPFPIFFIIGKEDPVINAEKMVVQAEIPRDTGMLLLENVGHMGFLETKEETLNAVEAFARKCFRNKGV